MQVFVRHIGREATNRKGQRDVGNIILCEIRRKSVVMNLIGEILVAGGLVLSAIT